MGVDVTLVQVSQKGTSSKGRRLTRLDSVWDSDDLFADMCSHSGLPMLNRVDPYRTQILTADEMAQFIAELDATWETLDQRKDRKGRDLLQSMRVLAERCASASDLELHLVGD
ncbi:hypothetical protein [Streptomyces sp. NPDC016845]|uniref:hypothetical protein n=1 Tax=Streptomyces sp. NPDC016845 TaxID=3364972 RepID=UPI0037A594E9